MTDPKNYRWLEPLRELCALPGPPGRERPVTDYLQRRWEDRGESLERTKIGNLLCQVGGRGPRLLVCAHADEICLMVRSITEDGFLRLSLWFRDSTGRPPHWLYPVGQPARVLTNSGSVEGTFATVTGHVGAQRGPVGLPTTSWDDLFVDVGARDATEARSWGIHPGCHVIWNTPLRRYANLVTTKALDDRVGLAIMDDVLADLDASSIGWELHLAATAMEEIGLVAAAEVAERVRPDFAIVLEVGLAGDIPGVGHEAVPVKLGQGPVIVFQDAATHYSWDASQRVLALARAQNIPVQEAIYQSYSSDGAEFIRSGVPTVLVTFPCRYTHSPFETAHVDDIAALRDLLMAVINIRDPIRWMD